MLDEIKEYEEYTCDLQNAKVTRLIPDVFKYKNHLNGLVRALTIIARYELEAQGYFQSAGKNRIHIISKVKLELKDWLGFEGERNNSKYCNWLKQYYANWIGITENDVKPWDEIKLKKAKQYNEELFSTNSIHNYTGSQSNDTTLQITYDIIIADAINAGPLKKYYLVCNSDYDKMLTKDVERKTENKKKYNEKKPMKPSLETDKKKIDNLMRLVGIYLVCRKKQGTKAVNISNADLANWAQTKSIFKGGYYNGIRYENEEIVKGEVIDNNYRKWIISDLFIDKYDIKVIESDKFNLEKDVKEGYTFFADLGSSEKYLSEKMLYK